MDVNPYRIAGAPANKPVCRLFCLCRLTQLPHSIPYSTVAL